jgi:hypothetical protein
VRADAKELQYVPEALKTEELCLAAVWQDGVDAMPYVPESLKTGELYHEACIGIRREYLSSIRVNMPE